MRYTWIDEYLMNKKGVTKNSENWNWIRYLLGGKMFAAVCLDEKDVPYYITLKLEPEEGAFLRTQYEDILPGYYMNKEHWNSVKPDGAVPDELLKDLLDKSYDLVLKSFSKKRQKEILEGDAQEEKTKVESRCGILCSECGMNGCKGCTNISDPFWGSCPVKNCCEGKKKQHCGQCGQFPCDLLTGFSYDKENGDNGKRIEQCRKWKE